MTRKLSLALALLAGAIVPLWAETVLFDFENESEAKAWHDERGTANHNFPVSRQMRFATSGRYALCLRTPQWQPGRGEWPAVETVPPVTDWSGYDRLVLDVTNPTAVDHRLMFFLSDTKVPTRGGLNVRCDLLARGYSQVVVDLGKLAGQNVNPKDMHVMHFFTERPTGDMEVYLDRLVLLRPGEALPVPTASFIQALGALQQDQLVALRQFQQEARARVGRTAATSPAIAAWAEKLLAENDARVATFADQVAKGDPVALQSARLIADLRESTAHLESLVRLRAGFEAVRQAVQTGGSGREDIVVGFASAMEKVLPRAGAPDVKTSDRVALALARNEKEALQVVVLPVEAPAKQVAVRVSDLRTTGGEVFPAENVDTPPMGYVETKNVPPYGSPHVGWWPDPILNFMARADIAAGDVQSFWVRFRAPKTQAPGLYRGKLAVLVGGQPLYAFDLRVEVYPFTLPDRSPLDLAVTFAPEDNQLATTKAQQTEWRKSPDYPVNAWKRHRLEWGDFLADYYLTYDSLYHRGAPDWEILQRLHQRGQLGRFNLGYYAILGDKPEEQEAWRKNTLARIKTNYEKARELGLVDHAYIYGCDENPEKLFPGVERATAVFKRECPGVTVMTTTYDHSFGTNSVIKSMDAFCPLTPRYDRALADQVRAKGQQVWWYTCCGPHHPYLNTFIEYPAIEGRLLMGAQTAKYRPDGYLYYEISIWNSQKPITSGPFTDWDPRSWTVYNGDGSWTCCGPDGTPLPTIRLENFRDGLEDYAYAKLLEEAIQRAEASARPAACADWVARARRALEVPASLMRSTTEYTHDPAEVYRWRRGMAEALKTAPE